MRRLFAIFVFIAGGFAAEMTHPLQCELVTASRVQVKRHRR